MTIKEASSYVERTHGGWGWWVLKVLVVGAGLATFFSILNLSWFFNWRGNLQACSASSTSRTRADGLPLPDMRNLRSPSA